MSRRRGPKDGVWDLLVIGGGTAGIVGATTAARLGASVLLVERDRTGGECLWTGCVPSKALLRAAHAAADARDMARFGITAPEVRVDFQAVMRSVHQAIATIEPVDSPAALEASGVTVVHGQAAFDGMDSAQIGSSSVRFRAALIAAGSAPVLPPIPGLPDVEPKTSETIWSLSTLPARLLIMGGGSIGCELGQAFARLGSLVTMVEAGPRLMAGDDPDAASLIAAALTADGVQIRTAAKVVAVTNDPSGHSAHLDNGSVVEFDEVLVAVGRRARSSELGLESADVAVDARGCVVVDAQLRTSNHRIWAAGDVTAMPSFTHVAGMHGSIAAGNAVLGLRRSVDVSSIPRVTYTQPEVAVVGVGGGRAGAGSTVRTIRHDRVDRAIVDGSIEGFSKLHLTRSGRIVGGVIVSPRAGESVAEIVLAVRRRLTVRDLAATMHAYPTYGDGVWKAAIAEVTDRLRRPVARQAISLIARLRRRLTR